MPWPPRRGLDLCLLGADRLAPYFLGWRAAQWLAQIFFAVLARPQRRRGAGSQGVPAG